MSRPYPPYPPYSSTPTQRLDAPTDRHAGNGPGYPHYGEYPGYRDDPGYQDYRNHPADEYDDYEDYDAYADFGDLDDEPIDRRWVWIAGVAGSILLVAVICTVVILGGGDSGSVSATVASPPQTSQPAPATTDPGDSLPPSASLSPETMTTVTPSPSATPTPEPEAAAPPPPPVEAAPPPPPVASPRTITYQVTGNRPLIDLVTIIYTDQRGALQTDVNVALPWSKSVVLDPGVELKSVTATSVNSQLNCSITDAAGAPIVAQANNSIIATCTQ